MKLFSKQDIGRYGEKIAARHLKKNGYRIIGRNLHFGKNELDLVAKNKQILAFVEVKTRSYDNREDAVEHRPALAVDKDKRERTVQAAKAYLHKHPTTLCPRLDVVEVYLDRQNRNRPFKINHIEAAFTVNGKIR
jgi:putative endonuclease